MQKYHVGLIIIILIAWALRLFNLTYHSLWFDEVISVYWARQTVARILEVGFTLQEDRLPPLYYLTLKGWGNLFGFGETAIRALSVIFGLLLLPTITRIASLLFSRRVALATAALAALNPFLIWYSQEVRMYAPAVFFSTLAILAFLHWLPSRVSGVRCQVSGKPGQSSPGPYHTRREMNLAAAGHITFYALRFTFHPFLLLFILAATAGLYSHLYTGFLLPALGLWLIISYPRAWTTWLTFSGAGLIIALAYSPIALAIWRFSAEAMPGDPLTGHAQRAWWLLRAFTLGQARLANPLQTIIPAAIALFTLLAFLNPKAPIPPAGHPGLPSKNPRLLIALLLIFPFLIATVLLFRNHLAFFGERYFIVMLPWLLLLAALGADHLSLWLNHQIGQRPPARPTGLNSVLAKQGFIIHHSSFIILVILTLLPIPGQWSIPASKEAWRQSVDYLAQVVTQEDAILIHPDWVRYPFQYYFRGPGQTYAAFSRVTAETALDGPLQGVVGDHPVIWLIQSHLDAPDPERRVEQWLATRYPIVTELYPPGLAIKSYAPGYRLDALPPTAIPVDFQFENGLQLVGYQVDAIASARDNLFHPPSGWMHVILYWATHQAITGEATPFVHLVGPEGIWGINLERPTDALNFYPPSHWPAATPGSPAPIIRHDLDVNLNPVTPPGVYQLVVGLPGDPTQFPLTRVTIR